MPNVERIPLATYQKIAEYAAKGGNVIFTKRLPSLAPGLRDEGDTPKIRELSAKFQLTDEAKLADALHAALPADFTVPPDVGVVHRKLPYSDIYFLANTTQSSGERRRRHSACKACRRHGGIRSPARRRRPDMDLDLAPYESRVLVFSKEAAPAIPAMSGPRFRRWT